jgi:hypothetical protein
VLVSHMFGFEPAHLDGAPAPPFVSHQVESFGEGPVEVGSLLMQLRVLTRRSEASGPRSPLRDGCSQGFICRRVGCPSRPLIDTTIYVEGILRVFADGPPPLSALPINLGTIPPHAEGDGDTPS